MLATSITLLNVHLDNEDPAERNALFLKILQSSKIVLRGAKKTDVLIVAADCGFALKEKTTIVPVVVPSTASDLAATTSTEVRKNPLLGLARRRSSEEKPIMTMGQYAQTNFRKLLVFDDCPDLLRKASGKVG